MRTNTSARWFSVSMLILAVMFLVGCTDNTDTPASPVEEPVKTASEVLSKIPGVTIIKDTLDREKKTVTYFYFDQPIDHEDASAGTFRQYCALHYKGPDHVTVLHTQGYSTSEPKYFQQLHLATNLDANYIEVEHRYYKHSLINFVEGKTNCYGDYWDVNTAAQSTADLHAIVTALKATGCFNSKWVSTGVSKNGILTALYAYFYPNEVDVYVPFCAPFCTGPEAPGIGEWLSKCCGLDNGQETQLRKDIWAAFQRIASDKELQEGITACYNQEHHTNFSVQAITRYVLFEYMRNMFYKFCYTQTSEWDGVIPNPDLSAEVYYRFALLGNEGYAKKLKQLCEIVGDEYEVIDSYDDDWDYMMDDDDDIDVNTSAARRTAPDRTMKLDKLLKVIYSVHAATELGHFLYDWSPLTDNNLITQDELAWLKNRQTITRNLEWYGVTNDGGKLMNGFLDFVKNNRNKDKCKMVFVYGDNDPWTGAAIPDPASDDPCVKKHIVPKGVHSGWINSVYQYPVEEKDWIMNTVKEMLK